MKPPGGLGRLVTGSPRRLRGEVRGHTDPAKSTAQLGASQPGARTDRLEILFSPVAPRVRPFASRGSNGRFCKNASLLAKSLTFVSEVQPSHTCGMSVAPLSSGLPTFPRNVDPSQLLLKFSKRANSMRVSTVRLQSVIGVSFSGSLHLPRLPVSIASKRPTRSHFGVSPCSLSCCLLVSKI